MSTAKKIDIVLFLLCSVIFLGCNSLAFAGGWVGQYANTLEYLAVASFAGCVVFGSLGAILFREMLFGKPGPK